jgi:hypothetical protein
MVTRAAPRPCIIPTSQEIFETLWTSRVPNTILELKGKKIDFGRKKYPSLNELLNSISPFSFAASPRWQLRGFTTTMTDIFSSKMFKREGDEMKLKKKHQRELAKVERAQIISMSSLIGSVSTVCNYQTEPIRPQFFPSFVDGHPVLLRVPNLIITPPATPEPHDVSTKYGADGRFRFANSSTDSTSYENLHYPSPTQKQNRRLSPPEDLSLPVIPIRPLALKPKQKVAPTRPELSIPKRPEPEPGFITLPSTPFSHTTPLFRHGPIRIERHQRYFSPEDESLDWAAFQVSIIGVSDNQENVQDEVEWTSGELDLDDLESWISDSGIKLESMVKAGPDGWIKACV